MSYKACGISGSPVKDGNVESFLKKMVDFLPEEEFSGEILHLSDLSIEDCIHCNYCMRKQKKGKYCALDDDAQKAFEAIETSDIVVLASPVYFMRTSARMAALIDRLRVFMYGNLCKGRLKNKIGVSAAVAWNRHGGVETTHLSHLCAFMTLGMIPAGTHLGISPLGASAVATPHGSGIFNPSVRLGADEDRPGEESARAIMGRAAELARLAGK